MFKNVVHRVKMLFSPTLRLEESVRQALSIEKFNLWLQSHEEDEIIGYTCRSSACPIANYLSKALDATAIVGKSSIAIDTSRLSGIHVLEIDSVSNWARLFVCMMDYDLPMHSPVTTRDAICVLESVASRLLIRL